MTELVSAFSRMTLEQLRLTNKALVAEINKRHAQAAAKAAARFRVGDLIEFVDDRRAVKVQARIERINQKSLSCRETSGLQTPWRVSPNLCRLLGA